MNASRIVRHVALGTLLVASLLGEPATQPLAVESASAQTPPGTVDVAPLPEGLDWLNTDRPLKLAEFRGKFVLLDFWTYCCINCMHILPELKQLEQAYPNNLVVIGVHSAKFENEKDVDNIREAIDRYEIEHPVVVDSELTVWQQFGARAWPTIILIDSRGKEILRYSGEITAKQIAEVLDRILPIYRRNRLLDERPVPLARPQRAPTPLRFPGKVLADPAGQRLFIADSNHNRIVVVRADGTLVDTIGSGRAGRADGRFDAAEFNKPQGMALVDDVLYVADTQNHLVRRVDLLRREVKTVAGTGEQLRELPAQFRTGKPLRTRLASPWALWPHEKHLYIAMAGPHQIWRMTLAGTSIGPYAGNGREDIVDGPLLPKQPFEPGYSSFAQPSGLASDGKWLFVADSEGSSIRAVPLDGRGGVQTLVGTARLPDARLFTFGDVDGPPSQARLQHPLGVVFHRDRLYVADTYNNKIKQIDPKTGTVQTIAGDGAPGNTDSPRVGGASDGVNTPRAGGVSDDSAASNPNTPARFNEPAGLTAAGGKLYVADTNNHLIRVIDLDTGNQVSTLAIPALARPAKTEPRPKESRPKKGERGA